jgi:hypothetical protein
MNLAGHLGILSAQNTTDQTWRLGDVSRCAWVWRLAELVRIPRNGTWQSHWLGGRRRHVIAHVGGVAVEETLLALVSGLAGRRTRAQWCWMTMTWV